MNNLITIAALSLTGFFGFLAVAPDAVPVEPVRAEITEAQWSRLIVAGKSGANYVLALGSNWQ